MEQFIIKHLKSKNCTYIKIDNKSDLLIIYDLFKNNKLGTIHNSTVCLYYGLYYEHLMNYNLMKKYYLISIDYNNDHAMYNLGDYYHYIEKDYDLMKKYYIMAVNCGNSKAMNSLGIYYKKVEKDYDLMKKYYVMAINCNNAYAMGNLGFYYQDIEKDYNLMKKKLFYGCQK